MIKKQFQEWLEVLLSDIGAMAGTVHVCEDQGLRLAAAVNIPDVVQQAVTLVPSGKGMAGLALERGEPIMTCNLNDDQSGNVRPGAKAVNVKAAVAIPIRNSHSTIVAVVGMAFTDEKDIGNEDLKELADRAHSLLLMIPVE